VGRAGCSGSAAASLSSDLHSRMARVEVHAALLLALAKGVPNLLRAQRRGWRNERRRERRDVAQGRELETWGEGKGGRVESVGGGFDGRARPGRARRAGGRVE